MITAVQRKALSDEDIRTNQQFAKLFEDTIKVGTIYTGALIYFISTHVLV